MSFVLNLQGKATGAGQAPDAVKPSTWSFSLCFSNASLAIC